MLTTHSVGIAPLQPAELEDLRRLARSERGFAEAARRASRLTFLSSASGGDLDPEAALAADRPQPFERGARTHTGRDRS